MTTNALPPEAEKLLAVAPEEWVAARDRLARTLRDGGRPEHAAVVAGLRKPTAVVFAVNRAARDRPKAARAAADAAGKVKQTQVGNKPEAFKQATDELDNALDLLAEVAVAHVAPRGKAATDAMRRRVRDLLRSAVADDEARKALARGALVEELEAVGFSSYEGMAPAPPRERKKHAKPSRGDARETKRRDREAALREELADAEDRLKKAEKAHREAERERTTAERAVTSARAKLDRID